MSVRRTERLLNLVIALLSTRRWLTKEQIRVAVPQYADCESTEAFDRMFERDKEDLRELGVPLVTGSGDAWFGDEVGYRVDRAAYPLPQIEFTPQELAVVGLASRVWQQASLAGPAARALAKLHALGIDTDDESLVGVEPRVRTTEPAFEPLYAAARDRAPVRFTYRKASGETSVREVEPWLVSNRGGRWYLLGLDRGRAEARRFRLSRVVGQIERIGGRDAYDIPAQLNRHEFRPLSPPVADRSARLRVRRGRGAALRLRGRDVPGDGPPDGWDSLDVDYGETGWLAEELAGYGPDVVVESPQALRAAVVERLSGARAAQRAGIRAGLEPAR